MKALFICLLVSTFGLFGNAQTAVLTGTVYDAMGAVVTQVKVKAVDGGGTTFQTVTDEEGSYLLKLPYSANPTDSTGLKKYVVSFDKPESGFEKKIVRDFIFVSSTKGEMYLDCVIEGRYIAPNFHY